MLTGSRGGSAARHRLLLAVRALAGTTLAFALSSCGGDSDRDTDDAESPRGGTSGSPGGTGGNSAGTAGRGGSSGGGTTGTGGYFDPCASFVSTYNTVCEPPRQFPSGGAGGAAGSSGTGGASAAAGSAPTIEECRRSPPNCPLPSIGIVYPVTVQDGLCCVSCQTICG